MKLTKMSVIVAGIMVAGVVSVVIYFWAGSVQKTVDNICSKAVDLGCEQSFKEAFIDKCISGRPAFQSYCGCMYDNLKSTDTIMSVEKMAKFMGSQQGVTMMKHCQHPELAAPFQHTPEIQQEFLRNCMGGAAYKQDYCQCAYDEVKSRNMTPVQIEQFIQSDEAKPFLNKCAQPMLNTMEEFMNLCVRKDSKNRDTENPYCKCVLSGYLEQKKKTNELLASDFFKTKEGLTLIFGCKK